MQQAGLHETNMCDADAHYTATALHSTATYKERMRDLVRQLFKTH
jgi:hypothetical protein